jgi:hypothetical protein
MTNGLSEKVLSTYAHGACFRHRWRTDDAGKRVLNEIQVQDIIPLHTFNFVAPQTRFSIADTAKQTRFALAYVL